MNAKEYAELVLKAPRDFFKKGVVFCGQKLDLPVSSQVITIPCSVPVPASARGFLRSVLREMGVDFSDRDTFYELERKLIDSLRIREVRMLVLKNFAESLTGRADEDRKILTFLKTLLNEGIAVVLTGKDADWIVRSDEQLERRFVFLAN